MTNLLRIAITAAREAGDEVMHLYGTLDFETKTDGSPVTIADTRSNEILTSHLLATDISILSEESTSVPLPYPSRMWIIDPLDGTKDFLKKTKDFSVMIGLLEEGKPTLGVVYAPALDALYYAERGEGTFCIRNGVTTKIHTDDVSGELRFICSVNNFTPYMETVTTKLGAIKIPRGSIGIKAGLLGEDAGDFFFSHGHFGEWDTCAPEIIATEAGIIVTDCDGNPLFYGTENHRLTNGAIFSKKSCYERVLEAVRTTPQEVGLQ